MQHYDAYDGTNHALVPCVYQCMMYTHSLYIPHKLNVIITVNYYFHREKEHVMTTFLLGVSFQRDPQRH